MSSTKPLGSGLTREALLCALNGLSVELGKHDVCGELCLFRSTVMVLAFTARLSTKDVDALFQPTPLIRTASPVVRVAFGRTPSSFGPGKSGCLPRAQPLRQPERIV